MVLIRTHVIIIVIFCAIINIINDIDNSAENNYNKNMRSN
ncbi:hypothetical protein SBF1_1420007 [Candidatus Desulfosporosinus infrequens]|uniref:Uncharacterized protein n=1 Tax=Candidatus Desulfosporosinus infrequens TaxID=2043169 RepID=A0A2U3K5U9_9FIRM|nr:hypothetical protein SBF1_1420007 [Candidatus Desulfosporosinus infrequens]